jgi:peptide/nickel transport system substrate-binding protein
VWDNADFDIQHVSYDDGYNFSAGDRVDFFSDVRMRQAIAYCMDRQAVVDQALYGLSEVINSYLPNNHPLYNSAAAVYPYDPTAGMALLDEVGWVDDDGNPDTPRVSSGIGGIPDGIPLTFYYETTDSALRQQVTQILAQSLAGCGIEVALWYHPAYEWYAAGPDGRLYGRKYDLGQFAWLTWVIPPCDLYLSTQVDGPDGGTWIPIMDPAAGPQTFIEDWVGVNTAGYFNPTYDTACNNALGALYGESGYTTNHLLAQQIFAADLPVIPLFLRLKIAASGPTITGYDLDPTAQEMWNIEEFNR